MTDYRHADEVEQIAKDLIASVPDHEPLADVRIDCVFRDKAVRTQGCKVLGRARKVGGLNAYLANPGDEQEEFFVLEVPEDMWPRLTEEQQRALVDHELSHMRVHFNNEGIRYKLSIRGHDLEEFSGVIERHGLWARNVESAATVTYEQLVLAVEEIGEFVEGLSEDSDE